MEITPHNPQRRPENANERATARDDDSLSAPAAGQHLRTEGGSPGARGEQLYQLGMDYFMGRDVKRDVPLALRILRDAADAGSIPAAHQVARSSLERAKTARDVSEAIETLTGLGNSGHAPSQYALGIHYFSGVRTAHDPERAQAWLELAAKGGHLMAKTTLGFMLAKGLGVQKDEPRGIALLKEASRDGVRAASLHLGLIFSAREHSPADVRRGELYLRKAALGPMQVAATELPVTLSCGREYPKSDDVSLKLINEAANAGSARAMRLVGIAYELGLGVDADAIKARSCYQTAAAGGDAAAQERLGSMHLLDTTAENYRRKAAYWFAKASTTGEIHSKYALGMMHTYGDGVERQVNKGLDLLTEAALSGHMESQVQLAELFRRGCSADDSSIGVPKNDALAVCWYTEASAVFCPHADLSLAEMHFNGEGGAVDLGKSRYFLDRINQTLPWEIDRSIQEHSPPSDAKQSYSARIIDLYIKLTAAERYASGSPLYRLGVDLWRAAGRTLNDCIGRLRRAPLIAAAIEKINRE